MSWGETILPVLSFTAIGSTIGLFLCGLQICKRIQQRGGTEGTGSAPFLIAFISCAFWTQYGLLKQDDVVIAINFIGLTMQSGYLLYYYYMTRNRRFLDRVITVELLAIGGMVYMVNYSDLEDHGLSALGVACVLLNIVNIGAPLFEVKKVIETKSSESMPLPLCLACFFVSVQWLLYGIIVDDMVIQVPNYVATVLSIIQLSMFVIYPAKKQPVYDRLENRENI